MTTIGQGSLALYEGRRLAQVLDGQSQHHLDQPTPSHKVRLEILKNPVHDLNGEILESGDSLRYFLNLVVREMLHHLTRHLFT